MDTVVMRYFAILSHHLDISTHLVHLVWSDMMLRCLVRWHLVVSWHHATTHYRSMELLRRLSIRGRRCTGIGILHSTAVLRNHWSIMRDWGPARLLLRREKGGILRAYIKTFRVISTLFSDLSSLARPVLHGNGT